MSRKKYKIFYHLLINKNRPVIFFIQLMILNTDFINSKNFRLMKKDITIE